MLSYAIISLHSNSIYHPPKSAPRIQKYLLNLLNLKPGNQIIFIFRKPTLNFQKIPKGSLAVTPSPSFLLSPSTSTINHTYLLLHLYYIHPSNPYPLNHLPLLQCKFHPSVCSPIPNGLTSLFYFIYILIFNLFISIRNTHSLYIF